MDPHNILQQTLSGVSFAPVPDAGTGTTLLVIQDRQVFELNASVAGGTRTLSPPGKAGLIVTVQLAAQTAADTIAVTASDSNAANPVVYTFVTIGTMVKFQSVCKLWNTSTGAKTFAWQPVFSNI
jgi:hypothetical protein